MTMSKKQKDLFYFPFYPSEFMMGTYAMNNTQRGAYISLLCYQFDSGPLELQVIQKTCEGIEEDIEVVLTKFKKNRKGLYYNQKLEEVKSKAQSTLQKAKESGKKGAEKRWKGEIKDRDPIRDPNGSASNFTEGKDSLEQSIEPEPYNSLDELYSELSTDR